MKHTCLAPVAGLLLVVLFLSFPEPSNAQFRIGARGGVNVATLSVSPGDFYWDQSRISSYVGAAFGGIMQADFSGPFFLRFEPMYIQKGTNHRVDYATEIGSLSGLVVPLKLEFLQVPVSLGVQFGEGALRPYLFAGPNIGYMLTRGYNRTDFALDAGLGAEYAVSATCSVLLDVRYSAGLSNLNSGDPGAPELKSRGVQPMAGVLFKP